VAERVVALRDPALRARILSEDRISGSNFPLITRLSFDRMFAFTGYTPPREASIAAIAAREGRTPEEVAYDMLLSDEGRDFIFAPLTNYADYTLAASEELLRHRNTIIGLSDGGAHVGFISDGSFPTFVLTHWGKARGLPVEELIRRQTSDTAAAAGLADRGLLRPGLRADINLIDWEALALDRPGMVHDLPAGGRRLMQRAKGYRATLVAGAVTYRDGTATGALPGRLVRCAG
jgi:N-acyl-D-aspartate/D-glutamate deacylase